MDSDATHTYPSPEKRAREKAEREKRAREQFEYTNQINKETTLPPEDIEKLCDLNKELNGNIEKIMSNPDKSTDGWIAAKDREVAGCQFGCDPDKIGQARRDHMEQRVAEVTYDDLLKTITNQRKALEALWDIIHLVPSLSKPNWDIMQQVNTLDDFISAINKEQE